MTISDLDLILAQPRMFFATLIGTLCVITDMVSEAAQWESFTMKGFLLVCVVVLVREVGRLRQENKVESAEREVRAAGREERLIAALATNADALRAMESGVRKQNEELKEVMEHVIKRALGEDHK